MGLTKGRGDIAAADGIAAVPDTSIDAARACPTLAATTHFGTVGVLEERALVSQVAPEPDGTASLFHYRRASGIDIAINLPSPVAVAQDDLILVKSLTLPDGAVLPIAVRLPSGGDWLAVSDVEAALRPYREGTGRFIGWSGAAGSMMGMAAMLGIMPALSAMGAAAGLTLAFALHRRDRKDRRKIRELLG